MKTRGALLVAVGGGRRRGLARAARGRARSRVPRPAAREATARADTRTPGIESTGSRAASARRSRSSGRRASPPATQQRWIGVGGPGAGPKGETMWLQAGLAALPRTPVMLYVEITRAGHEPVFLPLAQNVPVGEGHRLAVLEMNRRPGVWRVWLDGEPATDPIVLRGLAQALEADRHGRDVERWQSRRAIASGSASSESASPGRSAARGDRSSRASRSSTAATSSVSCAPPPGASGRSRRIPSRRTPSTRSPRRRLGRDDLDGRPGADDLLQREDVGVAKPHTAV